MNGTKSERPGDQPAKPLVRMLTTELSDREVHWIGFIVANWGFIETEVFHQTMATFQEADPPPVLINNLHFTAVLELWKERVVDGAEEESRAKLEALHQRLLALHEHRAAIIHGQWTWDGAAPDQITTTRYVRRQQIRHTYNALALEGIGMELAEARYDLHYPKGEADRGREIEAGGGFMISRAAFAAMTGHPIAEELGLANGPAAHHPLAD